MPTSAGMMLPVIAESWIVAPRTNAIVPRAVYSARMAPMSFFDTPCARRPASAVRPPDVAELGAAPAVSDGSSGWSASSVEISLPPLPSSTRRPTSRILSFLPHGRSMGVPAKTRPPTGEAVVTGILRRSVSFAVPSKSTLRTAPISRPGFSATASESSGCFVTLTSVGTSKAPAGAVTSTPSAVVKTVSSPGLATKPLPSGVANGPSLNVAASAPVGSMTCSQTLLAMVTGDVGGQPAFSVKPPFAFAGCVTLDGQTGPSTSAQTDHGVVPPVTSGRAPSAPTICATPFTGTRSLIFSGWIAPPVTNCVEVVKLQSTGSVPP